MRPDVGHQAIPASLREFDRALAVVAGEPGERGVVTDLDQLAHVRLDQAEDLGPDRDDLVSLLDPLPVVRLLDEDDADQIDASRERVDQLGQAEADRRPSALPLGVAQKLDELGQLVGGDRHASAALGEIHDLKIILFGLGEEHSPLAARELDLEVVVGEQVAELLMVGVGQRFEDLRLELAVDVRRELVCVAAHWRRLPQAGWFRRP